MSRPLECHAGMSVLVVDDNHDDVAFLQSLLTRSGLERVYTETDSRKVSRLLSKYKPDLVLLALRMPRVDGFEVLAQIRKYAAGGYLPVMILTRDTTAAARNRAFVEGAQDFLTKPVDDVVLLAAIRRALEFDASAALRRRSQDDLEQRVATLTEREREVMALAIGGLMNKQIAGELGTTEITAKVHKRRGMEKMCARSLPDLVRMAEALGMSAVRTR